MDSRTRATLYAHVHILFWPWLWWQLFRLGEWIETTGRSVLISVDHWGNLYCNLVGDDPHAPQPWQPRPLKRSPWNQFPNGCAQLTRLGAGLSYDQSRTGDQAMLAAWLLSYYGRQRGRIFFHALNVDYSSEGAGIVAARAPP